MRVPALEVVELSKAFSTVRALRDVSLTIAEGAVVGLVGPNGAGKTTFFSLVAGFLGADHGEIRIFGETRGSGKIASGTLSILPQDARFARGVSIEKLFLWYAHLMGIEGEDAKQEVRRVLELVDLTDAAQREGSQLSHGMGKRMGIAQAFIGTPRLMLLDEPTAGLDPANAHQVRELIRKLRGERTVMVSSHNLDEVADICDHVTILDKGRVVDDAPISTFVKEESLVTFELSEDGDDALLAALEALPLVQKVDLSEDRRRLRCTVRPEAEATDAMAVLLTFLVERGVSFINARKGTTLQDRFLDVTGDAE